MLGPRPDAEELGDGCGRGEEVSQVSTKDFTRGTCRGESSAEGDIWIARRDISGGKAG